MRSPHYGKLKVNEISSEVYKIWLTRDNELPELPRHKWSWQLTTDPDLEEMIDLAHRLAEHGHLTDREIQAIALCVLMNATTEDAGVEMNCSSSRVHQILNKALRKLRHPWAVIPWKKREEMRTAQFLVYGGGNETKR